jgi:hypothetical protein
MKKVKNIQVNHDGIWYSNPNAKDITLKPIVLNKNPGGNHPGS